MFQIFTLLIQLYRSQFDSRVCGSLVCDSYGFPVSCNGALQSADAPVLLAALYKAQQSEAMFALRGMKVIVKTIENNKQLPFTLAIATKKTA
jgi:hypothetical protein